MPEQNPNHEQRDNQDLAKKWVTEVYGSRSPDIFLTEGDHHEVMEGLISGKRPEEIIDEAAAEDPNVVLKNKFLSKLANLSDEQWGGVAPLLAQLETHAEAGYDSDGERAQQFKGILEIVIACFNDLELHDLIEERKEHLKDKF